MILYVQPNWIILTAGFGAQNFREAALRVKHEAIDLGISTRIISVFDEDLSQVCPLTYAKYRTFLNSSHHGFGYFAWKSEIVFTALNGFWGACDGVIWIDGGCEINSNAISKLNLKKYITFAQKNGAAAFTLNNTDEEYSKGKLLSLPEFKDVDSKTPQFQATWFLLYGDKGRDVSKTWLDISLRDITFLDFSNEGIMESEKFIEHRFDQSILSMVLKSYGISSLPKYVPVSGHSVKSQFRGITHPIWTSRNRFGKSIKRKWLS